MCTFLLEPPQVSLFSLLGVKSTNSLIQGQSIPHVEVINNSFVSKGHARQEEPD